jgi:hypothetical protein
MLNGWLSTSVLAISIVLAIPIAAKANNIVAECDDPQGVVFYSSKLESTEKFGSKPRFFLDTEDKALTVFWDSYVDPKLLGQAIDYFQLKSKGEQAMVIFQNQDQITAMRTDMQGVYLYTLYPKLELGVFSAHRHWTSGETASNMYYGKCKFLR